MTKLKKKNVSCYLVSLLVDHLFSTAVPAMVRDIMTMRLVKKAKVQKTRWVFDPKRALMTCRSK